MSFSRSVCMAALGAALVAAASAVPTEAAPPFFGASSAHGGTNGPLGSGSGPVRVTAHLPANLACSQVVSVETGPGYYQNPGLDAFKAAPVSVTIAPGSCSAWGREWVRFSVPHPGVSDILALSFHSTSGQPLYSERVAITAGPNIPRGRD